MLVAYHLVRPLWVDSFGSDLTSLMILTKLSSRNRQLYPDPELVSFSPNFHTYNSQGISLSCQHTQLSSNLTQSLSSCILILIKLSTRFFFDLIRSPPCIQLMTTMGWNIDFRLNSCFKFECIVDQTISTCKSMCKTFIKARLTLSSFLERVLICWLHCNWSYRVSWCDFIEVRTSIRWAILGILIVYSETKLTPTDSWECYPPRTLWCLIGTIGLESVFQLKMSMFSLS